LNKCINVIEYRGKQLLLVDLSGCSADNVEQIVRAVPDYVTAQPFGSVLVLADFTGASFDEEAVRTIKEAAVFNKPYVKKSAWVGIASLPLGFKDDIKKFSRREFHTFIDRQEALDWLTKD
jgi:hypothetical protein